MPEHRPQPRVCAVCGKPDDRVMMASGAPGGYGRVCPVCWERGGWPAPPDPPGAPSTAVYHDTVLLSVVASVVARRSDTAEKPNESGGFRRFRRGTARTAAGLVGH